MSHTTLTRTGYRPFSFSGTWPEDIDDQAPGPNYRYDGSGNLIRDKQEGTWIRWNAEGKVEEVLKRNTAQGKGVTVKYLYNPAGNRVRKIVIDNLDSTLSRVTYYVRDANEQVVANYEGELHPTEPGPVCTMPPSTTIGDGDCDGVLDGYDNCATLPNPPQSDSTDDGVGDACEPCAGVYDPWGFDYDGDGTPDACDT